MSKCNPREIIKEVPDVQSAKLPDFWFDDLDDKNSVFSSLYEWLLGPGGVPAQASHSLHNRTYVGERLYDKLLAAERKRLKKMLKLKGDALEEALGWSDLNSGPRTDVSRYKISGDLILVIPESSRPAFNEFSIKFSRKRREAEVGKARGNAAGATFHQWLLSQIDRPDRVGDLARDSADNEDFPRNDSEFEEISSAWSSRWENSPRTESFKQAWLEYLQQYPERVQPCAWCSECGKKLEVEEACLAWGKEELEYFVLDSACLSKYTYDHMISRPLSGITAFDLEQLVEKDGLSELDTDKLAAILKLWGVMPITSDKGWVYFIRSEKTHAIKIGFTAGKIEDRLSSLQTAHPYKLQALAMSRGSRDYEKALHARFAKHRLEGEWFDPHPDLLNFISILPKR